MCYRSGLKTALGVRNNTNTEIIHFESGKFPLHCRVIKSQLKFWQYVTNYMSEFPDAALSKVVKIGLEYNLPYLRYYQKLLLDFENSKRCEESLRNTCVETWKRKIVEASADMDSKLGTYYRINPLLHKFAPVNVTENQRITITRFRTGSHSLAIEIGRFSNTERENRLCKCGFGVQTIWHVFKNCRLTRGIICKQYHTLKEIFEDEDIHKMLFSISKC